jgi:hypothetical protein
LPQVAGIGHHVSAISGEQTEVNRTPIGENRNGHTASRANEKAGLRDD